MLNALSAYWWITDFADVPRMTSTTGYREYLPVITSRHSPLVSGSQKSIMAMVEP